MDDALLELERGSLDPELRRACAAALSDRGDPRGEFLVRDLELFDTRVQKPALEVRGDRSTAFKDRQLALDELARTLDPDWLARVGALSNLRFYPTTTSGRPDEPPTLLPGSLRRADLEPESARFLRERHAAMLPPEYRQDVDLALGPAWLARENRAATLLQSFRWALPGPVLEIAVHGIDSVFDVWVPRVYWCTPLPRPDEPYVVAMSTAPPDRPAAIRFIREVTGCNLLTAKHRLDDLPCPLLETDEFQEVKAMVARVTALGAQVTLNGKRFPPDEPPLLAEGASLLEAGDPDLVVLRADEHCLEVRAPAIRWTGPHRNERAHVLRARWRWSELPADPAERVRAVRPAIEAAVAARRASFVECRLCRELIPPEWLHQADVCMGCAEKHLGVVH